MVDVGRVQGTDVWKSWPVEERHLYQTVRGLDPRRTYEVRMVARDGPYETPSQAVLVPASEGKYTTSFSHTAHRNILYF